MYRKIYQKQEIKRSCSGILNFFIRSTFNIKRVCIIICHLALFHTPSSIHQLDWLKSNMKYIPGNAFTVALSFDFELIRLKIWMSFCECVSVNVFPRMCFKFAFSVKSRLVFFRGMFELGYVRTMEIVGYMTCWTLLVVICLSWIWFLYSWIQITYLKLTVYHG